MFNFPNRIKADHKAKLIPPAKNDFSAGRGNLFATTAHYRRCPVLFCLFTLKRGVSQKMLPEFVKSWKIYPGFSMPCTRRNFDSLLGI